MITFNHEKVTVGKAVVLLSSEVRRSLKNMSGLLHRDRVAAVYRVIRWWRHARDILRNGNFQRYVWRRRSHIDDARAIRPDAAEQVRATRLRSRGLWCWRVGGSRPALFGTTKLWDCDTRRVVRWGRAVPARPEAVPGSSLPLRYWYR